MSITLTEEERVALVAFLRARQHTGHIEGFGCHDLHTSQSCYDCVAADRHIAVLTRQAVPVEALAKGAAR